jgi:hypothetical protein
LLAVKKVSAMVKADLDVKERVEWYESGLTSDRWRHTV